jgi:hypothetical protein
MVLLMIASSDEITMAASRADSSAASWRSVMSISRLMAPTSRPEGSRSGVG